MIPPKFLPLALFITGISASMIPRQATTAQTSKGFRLAANAISGTIPGPGINLEVVAARSNSSCGVDLTLGPVGSGSQFFTTQDNTRVATAYTGPDGVAYTAGIVVNTDSTGTTENPPVRVGCNLGTDGLTVGPDATNAKGPWDLQFQGGSSWMVCAPSSTGSNAGTGGTGPVVYFLKEGQTPGEGCAVVRLFPLCDTSKNEHMADDAQAVKCVPGGWY
jgi:hypothetical protein